MNDDWKLLRWEYVSDQCPEIQQKLDRDSEQTEYGINFYEFINCSDGLEDLASNWWNSLSRDVQKKLILDRLQQLEESVNVLKNHATNY